MTPAIRWPLAAFGAAALAWTTISIDMPWLDPAAGLNIAPPPGEACAADAHRARLDFGFTDLGGRSVRLSDYRGRVILLNFWATWCIPCRTEIPWFIEFQNQFGDAGLQVVGVSVDVDSEPLAAFSERLAMNYPVLQTRNRAALLDAYGPMPAIPTTVLISRDGRVCSKQVGAIARDALEQRIRALLPRDAA